MTILRIIPLLLFPMIIYCACMVTTGLDEHILGFVSVGGVIILMAILILLLEIAKATFTSLVLIDHIASLLVMVGAMAALILLPIFQTETFLILFSLSVIDVAGGIIISQRVAQRDIGVAGGLIS